MIIQSNVPKFKKQHEYTDGRISHAQLVLFEFGKPYFPPLLLLLLLLLLREKPLLLSINPICSQAPAAVNASIPLPLAGSLENGYQLGR
ncbi:hypothetical protein V6N13_110632 [Hibiscus sabdariffa]|uniref:Uncharacterized protein n=1 Tax=Hibiscus sabdariffa TaxID=183260 RepID=A0ABR2THT8_9ROSI